MQLSLLIQVGGREGDLDFDVSGLANWRSNCTLEVNFNLFCDEISCQFSSTTHFQQIKEAVDFLVFTCISVKHIHEIGDTVRE